MYLFVVSTKNKLKNIQLNLIILWRLFASMVSSFVTSVLTIWVTVCHSYLCILHQRILFSKYWMVNSQEYILTHQHDAIQSSTEYLAQKSSMLNCTKTRKNVRLQSNSCLISVFLQKSSSNSLRRFVLIIRIGGRSNYFSYPQISITMKYDVLYDDGEEVLSNVSLEEAQAYVDEHRLDCFSRILIIQKSLWVNKNSFAD